MNKPIARDENYDEPGLYEIRLKGYLDNRWAEWFEGMSITLETNCETVLTGLVVDQAALHGLLRRVRDIGMPLISIARISSDRIVTSEVIH